MIFRILDIETVPDYAAWTQGEPTYKLHMVPGEVGVRAIESPRFPPPHAHRVVAISYVDVFFDPELSPKYRYASSMTDCRWSRPTSKNNTEAATNLLANIDERYLLSEFGQAITPETHFVTWNGRTFDLPVIALRSLKHGIPCKWYYGSKDVRYRYSPEGHLDLMDFWADYGASRPMKLNDACRLIGLPGKTDMTGASIEEIYRSTISDPDVDLKATCAAVARYCLQDSIQTALLWVRSRHHIGKVTTETYNEILDTFAVSPEIQNAIAIDWDRIKL